MVTFVVQEWKGRSYMAKDNLVNDGHGKPGRRENFQLRARCKQGIWSVKEFSVP
jgi:hypothetical protein